MEYYIVVEEWHYPNNTDRRIIGDYDYYTDAICKAYNKYIEEKNNFLIYTNGDICIDACGPIIDDNLITTGFIYNAKPVECHGFFYRVQLIKREM